jgi:hypothetical protein
MTTPKASEEPREAKAPRKPYRSPTLTRLGTVAELTLGGATAPNPDGGAGSRKPGT